MTGSSEAAEVRAALRTAAAFAPTSEARATLEQAEQLIERLARELEDTEALQSEVDRLNGSVRELQSRLDQEVKYRPTGLWFIEQREHGSRHWYLKAAGEDIPAAITRASVLRHHEAIVDAISELVREIPNSAQRDAQGVPQYITLPSAAMYADRIVEKIAAALPEVP